MMPVRELDVSGDLDDFEIQSQAVTLVDFLKSFERIKPNVILE